MSQTSPQSNKKPNPYGFIYRTTLPNGQFYIGQHKIISQNTLDPNYFGSGVIIRDYLKSKGKQGLQREILDFGYSWEEMNNLEAKYLTESVLDDPLCINLDKGGRHKYTRYDEVNRRISKTMKQVRASKRATWGTVTGSKNNKSKRWKLVSPNGIVYEFHGSIDAFCKEHNLSANTMKLAIRQGWIPRRGVCAGWKGYDMDTGKSTTRDTANHGLARSGINNPSHKAKLKRKAIDE